MTSARSCSFLKPATQINALWDQRGHTKDHLGSGNKLLGVLEVGEHLIFIPGDALGGHGGRVGVAVSRGGFAAKETVEIRADLVRGTSFNDCLCNEWE